MTNLKTRLTKLETRTALADMCKCGYDYTAAIAPLDPDFQGNGNMCQICHKPKKVTIVITGEGWPYSTPQEAQEAHPGHELTIINVKYSEGVPNG